MTDDDVREIRRMKARIERERIPPGEDPQFHLKLGRGLALRRRVHRAAAPARARRRPSRRCACPATIDALERLRDAELLDADDADVLEEAYRFCERARNARYLQTAQPVRRAPGRPRRARAARRCCSATCTSPHSTLRDDYRRVTRRARRVVERVFYDT